MPTQRPVRQALLLLLALPLAALAQEAAMIKRATELREAPGASGRSLAPLPAQTPVTRLAERQGPWVQVRTAAGATGWVHLFDVGPASGGASTSADSSGSTNPLRGVTGLFSRGPATTATSGSGIRGLGAEDIAKAQPNPAALSQLETLRLGENDAQAFARAARLAAVSVEPLPAPARTSAGGRGGDPSNPQSP